MNKVLYNTNNKDTENQNISINNRTYIELSGISKVESMNEYEFYIVSILGNILLRGEKLEMVELDINKGTLKIKGKIYSLEYTNETKKKSKSMLGKIFKWSMLN